MTATRIAKYKANMPAAIRAREAMSQVGVRLGLVKKVGTILMSSITGSSRKVGDCSDAVRNPLELILRSTPATSSNSQSA